MHMDNRAEAFSLLLNACRSANVVELSVDITPELVEAIALHGPAIVLQMLMHESRELKEKLSVSDESLLQALQTFAGLNGVWIIWNEDLFSFVIRNCFKLGLSERYLYAINGAWDVATAMGRLMEFSFGPCADRYATNERHFRLYIKRLPSGFLKIWIQVHVSFSSARFFFLLLRIFSCVE